MILSTASDAFALGVTAFLIVAPLTLIGGFALFVRVWPWRDRFYWAWLGTVILSVALPVAIPYAIWSTDGTNRCEIHVLSEAVSETPFALLPVPVSIRNEQCIGDTSDPVAGKAVAYGPYGIPVATASVTQDGFQSFDEDSGRELFAIGALLGSMVVASLPFVAVLLRAHVRRMHFAAA